MIVQICRVSSVILCKTQGHETAGASHQDMLLPNLSGLPGWNSCLARHPFRFSINVTLDGCCDHRAMFPDEETHRHAVENIARSDALLFGRVTTK